MLIRVKHHATQELGIIHGGGKVGVGVGWEVLNLQESPEDPAGSPLRTSKAQLTQLQSWPPTSQADQVNFHKIRGTIKGKSLPAFHSRL